MRPGIDAILFDLYGTLLDVGAPVVRRGLPRALGVAARPWMRLVRNRLLTDTFADRRSFVACVVDELAPDAPPAAVAACEALVDEELGSVRPFDGVLPMLRFLKARGHRLGLISNLTSVHREPLERFGLRELFDAVALSCEEGRCKPEPQIYLDLCERLDADPGSVLMVGDSRPNDVLAPRQVGMRALRVGSDLAAAADVGWLDLETDPPRRLLGDGNRVELSGRTRTLAGLHTICDDEQGRHNLVITGVAVAPLSPEELAEEVGPTWGPGDDDGGDARLRGTEDGDVTSGSASDEAPDTGSPGAAAAEARPMSNAALDPGSGRGAGPGAGATPAATSVGVYCKRFLLPETVWVEEFAREILAMVGLPSCDAAVFHAPEPFLVMVAATGDKLDGDVDPPLAREIGRHCAVGYIFANADLRPRNAFVDRSGSLPVLTMLDLEHFFFNLALDVEGLEDPFDPATFDRLSADELRARLKRRVLTERTTRRAMRSFVLPESADSELGRAFRVGWVEGFGLARNSRDRICTRMEERVATEPYLIIGTHSYRRAMARIDVDEVRSRIDQDPITLFPKLAAFKKRS